MVHTFEVDLNGRKITLETGKMAKQANGAVVVRYGDAVVLVTACANEEPKPGAAFFPLTVDYREYTYSAGKIPGGFIKREGRMSEKETLTSRLIDRPIRPLFPEGFACETQIIAMVVSADPEQDPDKLAIVGAGAALAISDIPFEHVLGAVRVGLVNGVLIANPTYAESRESILNIVVAGTEGGIVMVEAGASQVSEAQVLEAIEFGHDCCRKIAVAIKQLGATRGETQALVTVTLGTKDDEQRIELLEPGESPSKRFMLHYNFPPFSVGEVGFMRGAGRREIGHGALAERSMLRVLPDEAKFPYTLRVVSDIVESNGSSSMATICGATPALMDAGVPIAAPVSGVAMGMVKEGDKYAILTDIAGAEDHYGDMDFKVAGTRAGITGMQMDIKVPNITTAIMKEALEQARRGRLFILDKMYEAMPGPSAAMSEYAPRIYTLHIPTDKIRDVIGPGGKVIRGII